MSGIECELAKIILDSGAGVRAGVECQAQEVVLRLLDGRFAADSGAVDKLSKLDQDYLETRAKLIAEMSD